MKRFFSWILGALFLCSLVSCARMSPVSHTFFALDTYCTLTVYCADETACLEVQELVTEFEDRYSVTRTDSLVSQINAGAAPSLDEEARTLLLLAQSVTRESGGAFDVTVAPLVEAYGFYQDRCTVPTEAQLQGLLPLVDGSSIVTEEGVLSLKEGQRIDLGGIAKGFVADACRDALIRRGATGGILSFGGNVCAFGTKTDGAKFTVAVTDPENQDSYLGTLTFTDASLVTAGGYQRGFTENGVYYHHILDPKTGRPADSGLLSASVLCKNGARADALSTACFVLGEEGALELWRAAEDFELILVRKDGSLLCTEGLEGVFVSEEKELEFVKKNP